MKNNKKAKQLEKKRRFPKRKLIIFGSYFIILPIVVIVALYTTTYLKNKIDPFPGKEAEKISVNKIDSFDFDFYCSKYEKPTKGTTSTTMEFKAAITNKKANYSVTSVSYQVVMGSNWNGYKSGTSSSKTLSFPTTNNEPKYMASSITSYDLKYPSRVLLFINIKNPNAYVLLKWKEQKNGTQEEKEYNYILTYDFDQYFKTGVTQR